MGGMMMMHHHSGCLTDCIDTIGESERDTDLSYESCLRLKWWHGFSADLLDGDGGELGAGKLSLSLST